MKILELLNEQVNFQQKNEDESYFDYEFRLKKLISEQISGYGETPIKDDNDQEWATPYFYSLNVNFENVESEDKPDCILKYSCFCNTNKLVQIPKLFLESTRLSFVDFLQKTGNFPNPNDFKTIKYQISYASIRFGNFFEVNYFHILHEDKLPYDMTVESFLPIISNKPDDWYPKINLQELVSENYEIKRMLTFYKTLRRGNITIESDMLRQPLKIGYVLSPLRTERDNESDVFGHRVDVKCEVEFNSYYKRSQDFVESHHCKIDISPSITELILDMTVHEYARLVKQNFILPIERNKLHDLFNYNIKNDSHNDIFKLIPTLFEKQIQKLIREKLTEQVSDLNVNVKYLFLSLYPITLHFKDANVIKWGTLPRDIYNPNN